MSHLIEYVDADELPGGVDWALVRLVGDVVLFIRRDRVTPRVLEEAWIGYRRLACRERALLTAV